MSPSSLVDTEDVRARTDALLVAHTADLAQALDALGPDTAPLVDAVRRILSGGKRLRAAFCYWSYRAQGGSPDGPAAQCVLGVGAALELFQAAALFHDDVMDDSDTRRGQPAAHRVFAAEHAARGWSGDARRFGESAAILLGDLALVASEHAFARATQSCDPDRRSSARAVFDDMRTEVTVGQYLDLLAQALPWGQDPVSDEARARAVIRAKSARYSVEHPITLGATLAGADDAAVAACRDFGLPLGEAFQLRDDVLGVFGDPETTGKPAGDDLREGKRTVLVSRALAMAREAGDPATERLLLDRLGDRGLDDETGHRLAEAIAATGAVEAVEELIAQLRDRAFESLDRCAPQEPGRTMLAQLAHAAVDRRA